jgi:hypothetical protein
LGGFSVPLTFIKLRCITVPNDWALTPSIHQRIRTAGVLSLTGKLASPRL